MTLSARDVVQRASQIPADIYHLHDPELLPRGVCLKRRTGGVVIYDSHEFFREDVSDKEWIPRLLRQPVAALAATGERVAVRRLSGVVAVNAPMAEEFAPHARRVTVVANYPRRDLFSVRPDASVRPESIIYAGAIDRRIHFPLMLDAMSRLRGRRPASTCTVLGQVQSSSVDSPSKASRDLLGANGIVLRDRVAHQDLASVLASHAVGWLPFVRKTHLEYAMPTKLIETMAVGRPVVVSDLPLMRSIVERFRCGIVVPWDDSRAHAAALERLLVEPAEAATLGDNGARAVREEMNWECQVPALVRLYRDCLADAVYEGLGLRWHDVKSMQESNGER